MRYELRLVAYDMMDKVQVVTSVYESQGIGEGPARLLVARSTTVQGTGEPDPTEWARDALVAALEDL